jgi:uncharacterized protein YeaO (DUF488 family)
MEIILKSVHEAASLSDGTRYLVESTWPENVQDLDLSPYRWVKELVPSYELVANAQKSRKDKHLFQYLYWAELEQPLAQQAVQKFFMENDNPVTFLYAGPSSFQTPAYYLKKYMEAYGCRVPQQLCLELTEAA